MFRNAIAVTVLTILAWGPTAAGARAQVVLPNGPIYVQRVDSLAATLQGQSRALEGELAAHFQHARQIHLLIWDAQEVARLAVHMRQTAIRGGGWPRLHKDLCALDCLFRHLAERVDHIQHDAYHGETCVYSNTRRLTSLMRGISSTLVQLQEVVETAPDRGHRTAPYPDREGFGRIP